MASERAKQLAAKQKAEAKAEKQRRKNSTDPADWSQWRQLKETFKMTREHDPALPWWMLGAALAVILVMVLLGYLTKWWWLFGVLALPLAIVAAMTVFGRRARTAAYKKFDGQVGSAEVALGQLGKKWVHDPVITAAKKGNEIQVLHRAIGPTGLYLIGEGSGKAMSQQLKSEQRKHEQVAYGIDVHVVHVGNGEGEVPLNQLVDHLKKQPKRLTDVQIKEVQSRLRALDAMRPKVPIPKGPINTKGARQAMRGR